VKAASGARNAQQRARQARLQWRESGSRTARQPRVAFARARYAAARRQLACTAKKRQRVARPSFPPDPAAAQPPATRCTFVHASPFVTDDERQRTNAVSC